MAKQPSNGKFLGQIPLHRIMRSLAAVIVMLVLATPTLAADSPGLDRLMGGKGRATHEKKIKNLVFKGGKRYTWKDFSKWGKQLFINGQVKKPPTGRRPSKPISKFFKCISCHNYEREDPDLTSQDPEARFEWIEKTGREIYLLQGATMWGVVNRETFYPDYYAIYHHLCVPKGKKPPSRPADLSSRSVAQVAGPWTQTAWKMPSRFAVPIAVRDAT